MAKKNKQQSAQSKPQQSKPAAAQNTIPWQDEKPTIVHLEKNNSHYEYCRMQMHDIEKIYRQTFIGNLVLCIFVAFLAIFKVYIQVFGVFSMPFAELEGPGATLGGGILQILFAMVIIVLGYLAWANYRTLNLILGVFYGVVTALGIFQLDYWSGILGVIGLWLYIYAIRGMMREGHLAELDGYPDFRDKFDISTSDIVVQTLMAHRGERKNRGGGVFSSSRSLRKRRRRADAEDENASAVALAEQIAAQAAKQKSETDTAASAEETQA